RREWLLDALLVAGVPVVFIGIAQVEVALTSGQPIPRPVGTLGNPNALAAFLILLIPLTAGRFMAARSPLARVTFALYCLGTLVLTALTYSRGGWFGAGVAAATWIALRFPVRAWWSTRSRAVRMGLITAGAVMAIAGGVFLVQSFGVSGRQLDLRTWIYETGLQLFSERPLTGHGLFTFGAGLARLNSLPPFEPHSHGHDIVLHVAAEMGIVGVAALALTIWQIVRAIRRPNDATTIACAAALAGVAAHQLVDLPAMMPAIALANLIVLAVAAPPGKPIRSVRWQPLVIAAGGIVLTGFGLWNAIQYSAYVGTLREGLASGDYRATAERLQSIANGDPEYPVYWQEQGMLLGWAASEGDADAARVAIDRFQRYTALAPDYTSGWANLAALHASVGETEPALAAMRVAVGLAPQSWSLAYRFAALTEANGDAETATQLYTNLITIKPDITLLPDWSNSPLRRSLPVAESELSTTAQTLLLLERGETEAARQFWHDSGADAGIYSNSHVVNLLIALVDGDAARAQAEYRAARVAITEQNARVWTFTGAAFLTPSAFDQQIEAARAEVTGSLLQADWELGVNINYIKFLSLAMPRQFLPQVGYTEVDPIILRLLASPDALAGLRAATGV
ncbi:MAG: O-antigen ligase family protein, partial [Anaerolineae bacterium]|nr:O-antigen ligase family protein [Anaerolineae bacterium]